MAREFISRLDSELGTDDTDEFIELADAFNLDVSAVEIPIRRDLLNLRDCSRNIADCKRCSGSNKPVAGQCYKLYPEVKNGRIIVNKTPCYKADAVKIINQSGIPVRYRKCRSTDFKVTDENQSAVDAAINCIDNNSGLFIYGSVRTGKTLLSSIIVTERANIGKHSYFCTITDMLDELRDFDDAIARRNKLTFLKNCPCLIIDDLGAEYQTDWVASTLFTILDSRYKAELQTIINSNFSLPDLAKQIKGYHGSRITRRIADMCQIVCIG